jgi:hypothetical protein
MGPCENASWSLQLVIAILAAFNTALATVLLDRRLRADRERKNGANGKSQHNGPSSSGPY